MQVSLETGEGTERKLKIQVPAETLNEQFESRLKSMSRNVKIDGFRPGKVPLKVVKQHYGTQVFQEVAGDVIQKSFAEAIDQEKLSPAGYPSINAEKMEIGEPLEFTATFDVFEEIKLAPVADIKVEQLEAEVEQSDIDKMLETLQKQRMDWNEVERESKDGDRVSISFTGTIDGEAFDGGSAEDVPIIIGSGSMIPGFEDQLKGLAKEAVTTIKVPFPDDYQAKDLAGKDAEFAIEVKKVEESSLPAIDDEFAKSFGIAEGGIEKLKEEVKNNMERELVQRIRADLKTKVMDQLIENNSFDVPQSVVKNEAENLQKNGREVMQGQKLPIEMYMDEAERRVRLGMILGEVVKEADLKPTKELIDQRIELMSKDYAQPEEFVKHYQSNPELKRSVETLVVEELAVDWIVDKAQVSYAKKSFEEVTNPTSGAEAK